MKCVEIKQFENLYKKKFLYYLFLLTHYDKKLTLKFFLPFSYKKRSKIGKPIDIEKINDFLCKHFLYIDEAKKENYNCISILALYISAIESFIGKFGFENTSDSKNKQAKMLAEIIVFLSKSEKLYIYNEGKICSIQNPLKIYDLSFANVESYKVREYEHKNGKYFSIKNQRIKGIKKYLKVESIKGLKKLYFELDNKINKTKICKICGQSIENDISCRKVCGKCNKILQYISQGDSIKRQRVYEQIMTIIKNEKIDITTKKEIIKKKFYYHIDKIANEILLCKMNDNGLGQYVTKYPYSKTEILGLCEKVLK